MIEIRIGEVREHQSYKLKINAFSTCAVCKNCLSILPNMDLANDWSTILSIVMSDWARKLVSSSTYNYPYFTSCTFQSLLFRYPCETRLRLNKLNMDENLIVRITLG